MTTILYEVSEARDTDIESILSLYAQPDYDNGEVVSQTEAISLFERVRQYPFYKFFVVRSTSRIVGVYGLLVMDNIGHRGTPSAIVEGVAVAPDMQGRGIGTMMMRHAIEVASAKGCYKLALSSNLKRAGAHRFYEKLQFRQHGLSYIVDIKPEMQEPSP